MLFRQGAPGYVPPANVSVLKVTMLRSSVLAFLLIVSGATQACTCSVAPLDAEIARSAKSVIVFRIMSAKVSREQVHDAPASDIVGRVKIVDQLRGRKSAIREIRFSTGSCCGSRLDVGSYFVAFISNDGSRFTANIGNVVEVGKEYPTVQTRTTILDFLDGRKTFEESFSRELRDRSEQSPVLAPCPRNS